MTGSKRAFLADSSSAEPETGKLGCVPVKFFLVANSVIAFTHSA
ncbi:MAG: hypothetical protein ACRDOU_28480 [Streptosporangiaceae bacterium]